MKHAFLAVIHVLQHLLAYVIRMLTHNKNERE